MRYSIWLAILGGLASLGTAKSPITLSPLDQSANPFATSLNPRLRDVPLRPRDLPTGTCNAATPCANKACCGKDNLCCYSPKSCASGCQHNCRSSSPSVSTLWLKASKRRESRMRSIRCCRQVEVPSQRMLLRIRLLRLYDRVLRMEKPERFQVRDLLN